MAVKGLYFEGGTEGAALTPANTGAVSISLQGTSTARFRGSAKQSGAFGAEFIAAASSYSFARVIAVAESGSAAAALEFICPALPTAVDKTILAFRSGGTTPASLAVNAAITPLGKIRVQAGAVTVVNPFPTATTGDNVLVPGQSYLLEMLVSGQSATNGRVEARLTRKSSGAVIGTVLSTTANVTTNLIGGCDFGVLPTTDQSYTLLLDNARLIDNNPVGQWPGAYVAAADPLTGSATVTPTSGVVPFTVTAVITTEGGTGTAKVYTYNWGDGTPVTSSSSATATHTYSAAGNQNWTFTAANT